MTDTTPLISLENIRYAPGGVEVLTDITLDAREKRIGILGRNGSGKTSLARVMAGLVAPQAGRLRIAGVDVARDRKAALGTVGILFQNPDHQIIFPTVEEELAFGLHQMGQSEREAAATISAILTRFGKAHWAPAPIVQLSQGQRQLVCLMAVLAMEPRVIILDEPFAGLDIPTTMQLARVLDGLSQTVVLITHQPEMLRGYERAIWIDGGRVVRDGPCAQVAAAYTKEMTRIGARDDLSDLAG